VVAKVKLRRLDLWWVLPPNVSEPIFLQLFFLFLLEVLSHYQAFIQVLVVLRGFRLLDEVGLESLRHLVIFNSKLRRVVISSVLHLNIAIMVERI